MSHLQWLGIWGMTGFAEPTKEDFSRWTQRLDNVLGDPNGVRNFKKFIEERPEGAEGTEVLKLWEKCVELKKECAKHIKQGGPAITEIEKEEICRVARKHLVITDGILSEVMGCINSGNEDQIKKGLEQLEKEAREYLIEIYNKFKDHLNQLHSSKKAK